jgi:hypothetical protein
MQQNLAEVLGFPQLGAIDRHFRSIVVVDEPVVASSEQIFVVLIRSSALSRDSNASGPIWVTVVCSVGFVVVTVQ